MVKLKTRVVVQQTTNAQFSLEIILFHVLRVTVNYLFVNPIKVFLGQSRYLGNVTDYHPYLISYSIKGGT